MKANLVVPDIRDNYIENLLTAYGIQDLEKYLNPTFESIQNPEDFNNIKEGAELLINSCNNKEKILLIVDCDCDGFTSAAIFYQYVKRIWPDIDIEYRLHEGKQHGLEDHIDWIESNPVYGLIVLPDSSSNDKEYHDRLLQYGMKCLILDHHITDVELSDNAVVINNQLSEKYLNKDLTGAGVVYQFCRYLDSVLDKNYANDYIDLAALGIDGDMGSLLNIENRTILDYGFKNINNFFFKCLIDKQSYSMGGKITPISVAFYIVPLINAMIRVGTMAEKERMFLAFIDGQYMVPSNKRGAKGTLEMVAVESARECTNARNHQNKFKEEMVEKLSKKIDDENLLKNKILFIRLEDDMDFPSELNGLVCMNLVSKYKRPTIVARLNKDGEIKGSARGLNQSELESFKNFLTDSGFFMYAQGHDNAFGVGIEDRELDEFHKYANDALKDINFNESVYDVQFAREGKDLDINDIIEISDTYSNIWGTDVPEPLIYIKKIRITPKDIQIMGKNQDTLKITYNGIAYMKFHAKEMIAELSKCEGNMELEFIGRGNINEWGGRKTPQIFIDNYNIVQLKDNNILDF